ncbi:MAG: nucleotide exchange factor GrpE [Xanthomonadales bacterium]|nr:nucleotide exchange factor GrpE [Xanthomonadales bacterium]
MTVHQNDDENMTEDNEEEIQQQAVLDQDDGELESDLLDPVEELKSELQAAQLAAVEARQDMLRMQADMDNLRKRLVREHEKTRLRTLERFMNDLLPVRDSLERGLEAANDPAASVEALTEGKQLIMKMLTKAMGDHGLKTIDPTGEVFDPEKHEAMTMLISDQHDENTVIEVMEKGYQLHDRLIRPAKVVVSRKP